MYSELAKPSEAPAGAVSGGDDPSSSDALGAFAGAPAALLPALQRRGFERLTDVQSAIAKADDGVRDLRITSQTGSGKTVALGFSLVSGLDDPARRGPTTLVIAPTRELAMQVKEELGWLFADLPGVTCEVVTGGTSIPRERMRLKKRPTVVVGTPGRLLDHLRERALDVSSVKQLVLDEADQMLDLGFKDELDGILEQIPAERRTHLVSATFPRAVLELANRFQREPLMIQGSTPNTAHDDIEHIAYRIGGREHYAALVNLLLLAGDERTLVFVRTREDTTTLADKLAADGFGAMPLNGDLAQAQRTRTLAAFRGGTVRTLVATDVAARGLDVPSVTTVVHVDPPIDSATYVHRSGRTGRAGQKGQSVMFVPKSRESRSRRLYREARVEPRWAPVPGAAAVQARQLERAEAVARDAIEQSQPASAALAKAAENLLAGRDPTEVVAVLLSRTMSTTRAPFELARQNTPVDRFADRPDRPHRQERSTGAFAGRSFDDDAFAGPRSRPATRQAAAGPQDFARFRINWGFRGGADPRRILAHVCRRGGIDSKMVGSIDLQTTSSTFEVDGAVAGAFARKVQRRDSRDPHLVIVPADSARPRPRPNYAGKRKV